MTAAQNLSEAWHYREQVYLIKSSDGSLFELQSTFKTKKLKKKEGGKNERKKTKNKLILSLSWPTVENMSK